MTTGSYTIEYVYPVVEPVNGRREVNMSYVAPEIKEKFETLSIDLKNAILERNVQLYTIHDLINVLDDIVKEADQEEALTRK